ncbi:hypothetical protein Q427_30325 [Halomonas sp. BC04]|nr:hypothetical protein [Halomonas sp. BC04]EWG98480.1 hypothetical protein Q427_30325 [Halomonas sp. BC04]
MLQLSQHVLGKGGADFHAFTAGQYKNRLASRKIFAAFHQPLGNPTLTWRLEMGEFHLTLGQGKGIGGTVALGPGSLYLCPGSLEIPCGDAAGLIQPPGTLPLPFRIDCRCVGTRQPGTGSISLQSQVGVFEARQNLPRRHTVTGADMKICQTSRYAKAQAPIGTRLKSTGYATLGFPAGLFEQQCTNRSQGFFGNRLSLTPGK